MMLFNAFTSGSVIESTAAAPLTTREGRWHLDHVELVELIHSGEHTREWFGVGVGVYGAGATAQRYGVHVTMTSDGNLEIMRLRDIL